MTPTWTCPRCRQRTPREWDTCWTTGCRGTLPKPKQPTVASSMPPIPDRAGRLAVAIRRQWQCPCGSVKAGDFCANCGRCFAHNVPLNQCACRMGGD